MGFRKIIGRKGVSLMLITIILFLVIGIVFVWKETDFSVSSSTTQSIEMSRWSENKFDFDSDIGFLENVLWILGENFAYENGQNGGLYGETWDKVSGLVCWNCKMGIPPEESIASNLSQRVNETYKDYFLHLYITPESHTPLNFNYERNNVTFSYLANFSYSPTNNKDFYMNESNVWINSTSPLIYFLLYDKGKEFVQNEEINKSLAEAMGKTTVCTSDGILTEDEATQKTREVLKDLSDNVWDASRWHGSGVGIHLNLKDFYGFSSTSYPIYSFPPIYERAYMINFTYVVNTTVRDENGERMIPTEDGMKYLDLVFGLNKSISFFRLVDDLSSGGINPECNSSYPDAECTLNSCKYWVRKGSEGEADDCEDNEYCYVQYEDINDENCNCNWNTADCENEKGCTVHSCESICSSLGYNNWFCTNQFPVQTNDHCSGDMRIYDIYDTGQSEGACQNDNEECFCQKEHDCSDEGKICISGECAFEYSFCANKETANGNPILNKEFCKCTSGGGCKTDNFDNNDNNCESDAGGYDDWEEEAICLEGDGCCVRPNKHDDYLGQCLRIDLTKFENKPVLIKELKFRIDRDPGYACNDDLDIYACYDGGYCPENENGDWKVIKDNIDGTGPKIITLTESNFSDKVKYVDICPDSNGQHHCDHKVDWVNGTVGTNSLILGNPDYYKPLEHLCYEYGTASHSEDPDYQFCVFIDGTNGYERTGELTFDINGIPSKIKSAKLCAFRTFSNGAVTNYIQKLTNEPSCGNAYSVSSPNPSWKSFNVKNKNEWQCFDITDELQSSLDSGKNKLYLRWFGNDINNDISNGVACYAGFQDLNNCGSSNPSGEPDCRPYLEIWK